MEGRINGFLSDRKRKRPYLIERLEIGILVPQFKDVFQPDPAKIAKCWLLESLIYSPICTTSPAIR